MMFSIDGFFSKCEQISFLRIWSEEIIQEKLHFFVQYSVTTALFF